MKITYKLLCLLLSVILMVSIGCATFYAEPDDNADDQTPNTSDVTNPPDYEPQPTEPQDPNYNNQPDNPDYNDNPDYTGNTSDNTYNFTDDNQDNSFDFTDHGSANGYTDTDGNWVPNDDSSQYGDDYSSEDTQQPEDSTEATLYDTDRNVDTDTLSSEDWKLNLNTNDSNTTGDFNFIKNNNSRFDSNFSIMLLYGGIALIVISVIMMSAVIYKSVHSKKKAVINRVPFNEANNQKTKPASSKKKHHYKKSDTAEINLNNRRK